MIPAARTLAAYLFLMLLAATASAQNRVGWWKFDDTLHPMAAEQGFGSALEPVGTVQMIGGPGTGNGAVRIDTGCYLRMTHGIPGNAAGLVNRYTLQIDFRVAQTTIWHCLFQTDTLNAGDGDCFISPEARIGVSQTGYTQGVVAANAWYRFVLTVDNGNFFRIYLDGELCLDGNAQTADGRYALARVLLLFADDNGEDGAIDVAEVAIWDGALTADAVRALGGYGNIRPVVSMTPYLQAPSPTSITVSWHDTAATFSAVDYGFTPGLGHRQSGSSVLLDPQHRLHMVTLTGLDPNTEYWYRCISGRDSSALCRFRTQPDTTFAGHVRFLLLGDSQTDTARFADVMRNAAQVLRNTFGDDVQNHVNLIAHIGDIVSNGAIVGQYEDEFLRPMTALSTAVPTMVSIGNHEVESPNYYRYMHYADVSPFKAPDTLAEKFYAFTIADARFIFLNTNLTAPGNARQTAWLDAELRKAEASPATDFVFVFCHKPAHSELWPDGNNAYVEGEVLDLLRGCPKVQHIAGGHTHGYERGIAESLAPNDAGGFHLLISGGAGGALDRWGMYKNQRDYPEIHAAYDQYNFVVFDIDVADRSYTATMYAMGNPDRPRACVALDSWHRRLRQDGPLKPDGYSVPTGNGITLSSTPIDGPDAMMSVRFQITDVKGDYSKPVVDSIQHWRNIHGVTAGFEPIDEYEFEDVLSCVLSPGKVLVPGTVYSWRCRLRDQNLRWSEWSDEREFSFKVVDAAAAPAAPRNAIVGVFPNPCRVNTGIAFTTASGLSAELVVMDAVGRRVKTLAAGRMTPGMHTVVWDARDGAGNPVPAGMYYCRLIADGRVSVERIVVQR